MTIAIKGVKVCVRQAMKDEFEARLNGLGEKYFGKVISGSITCEKLTNGFVETKISIHPAEKKEFFAKAEDEKIKSSFSEALHKLDGQLSKDHAKLVRH